MKIRYCDRKCRTILNPCILKMYTETVAAYIKVSRLNNSQKNSNIYLVLLRPIISGEAMGLTSKQMDSTHDNTLITH